jgi:hypothetical protein
MVSHLCFVPTDPSTSNRCQERPLNVTCEPPSREPVRARACNREIAGKHVTQVGLLLYIVKVDWAARTIPCHTCCSLTSEALLYHPQKFFPISFAGFEEDVVACVPKKVYLTLLKPIQFSPECTLHTEPTSLLRPSSDGLRSSGNITGARFCLDCAGRSQLVHLPTGRRGGVSPRLPQLEI